MIRRIRPCLRPGVSAVEAAIVMPLLVILCLGLLDAGRIINVQILLKNAAREAASQASTGSMSDSEVAKVASQYLSQSGLEAVHAKITVANETSPGIDVRYAKTLDPLRVTVKLPLQDVTWLPFGFLLPSSAELNATCVWLSRKSS